MTMTKQVAEGLRRKKRQPLSAALREDDGATAFVSSSRDASEEDNDQESTFDDSASAMSAVTPSQPPNLGLTTGPRVFKRGSASSVSATATSSSPVLKRTPSATHPTVISENRDGEGSATSTYDGDVESSAALPPPTNVLNSAVSQAPAAGTGGASGSVGGGGNGGMSTAQSSRPSYQQHRDHPQIGGASKRQPRLSGGGSQEESSASSSARVSIPSFRPTSLSNTVASSFELPSRRGGGHAVDSREDKERAALASGIGLQGKTFKVHTPEEIRQFIHDAIYNPDPARPYRINEPPQGRPIRIYADGVYDLFHYAHALQLRQAKLFFPNVYLLVGVVTSEACAAHKAQPVMASEERYESVRNCKWVDEVIEDAPWTVEEDFIVKHRIDYVAHDEAPYKSKGSDDVYALVKRLGKFLPTRRTPGVSTSELLGRIVEGYRKGLFDGKLEGIGHAELMSISFAREQAREKGAEDEDHT